MSNIVEPTSPTLDESMPAPGRPDKDRMLGIGTPSPRHGGPLAALRLLDSVTTTPACWTPPTSRPEPTASTST